MPLDVSKEDLETLIKGVVAGALKEAGVVKEDVDKKKDPKPVADDNEPDEDDAAKMLDKMFGEGSAKKIAELMNKKAPIEPVQKSEELAKRDAEIVDLRKHVHDLTERQAREDFAKRATSLGLVKEDGEKLRKAYAGDVAALGWMEETIRKLQTQVEKAGLFNEIGDNRGGAANITAHDELLAKAKEIQKADPKLTEASAYVRAMEVYPEIAKRESQERLAKVQKLA